MNTSDWIDLAGIVTSLIFSFVSFKIALASLEQTRKSIRQTEISTFEANRPYVLIYADIIDLGLGINNYNKMIVIKNFGKSAAFIDQIKVISPAESSNKIPSEFTKFDSLNGTLLAPNMVVTNYMMNDQVDEIEYEVTYHDSQNNQFKNKYLVNLDFSADLIHIENQNNESSTQENRLINVLGTIATEIKVK